MFTDAVRHEMTTETRPGVMTRMTGQVRQFICSLHGHDALLHFEQGRMSLLCTSCGYESPGWDVKESEERRQLADAKPRMVRMPLVGQRRVA